MGRYEFNFIVTDTELSEELQRQVSQAIAEAGTLAIAARTPRDAVTVVGETGVLDKAWVWRGIPPLTLTRGLQDYAAGKVGEAAGQ